MRIVHLITRLILGGAQENTLLSCEDLIRFYGEEVLLVTGPAIGPEGSLIERARAGGVPVEVIPSLRRSIDPWRDWKSYRAICRVLRQFRPDVVHTHSAKAGILGRLAAHRLKVPVVVHTVHGAPFYPAQNRLAWLFCWFAERCAARWCDRLVSVADAMTDLMVEAQVAPREKFLTIYSGMEVEPFLESHRWREIARQKLGFSQEQVVIGKIARLFPLKGHDDVVQAASEVIRQIPQARFVFVGGGILEDSLKRRIAQLGLSKYFHFTGLVPPQELPALLAGMDLVVHASLREGLARVLPQALIAGKPVVSYDVDGAREVVLPGKTGFLVTPGDISGLVAAICRLASEPELRERLGSEGRRTFTDQFRHQRMTEQLYALYRGLLAEKGRRKPSQSDIGDRAAPKSKGE